MEVLYRGLVVFTAILTCTFWGMPYIDFMWFTNEQLHLLDQGGLGSSVPPNSYLSWGVLATWLILSVGLYFYSKYARIGFIFMYVVSLVSSLFYGIQVLSPYEVVLSDLIALSDGAILTIAYFTSVGTKFEENS